MPDPIDPTTGKPIAATPDPAASQTLVTIPKEEWEGLKAKLDVFDRLGSNFNQQPAEPAAPAGPSLADQVKDIDSEIDRLDDQIDLAIADQKSIKSLARKRDSLSAKRLRLQIQHEDINPAINSGINTIDQLSAEITRGKMPYYELVKDQMNQILKGIPQSQRMSPEVRQLAYETALGKNMDKVLTAEREKMLREAAAQPALDPTHSGRGASTDPSVPKARDVLGPGGMAAIREKGQTVDQHFQSRGYKGGWPEYYKKHEDYFKDQGFGEED
jgi:hypothetical protein